MAGTSRQGINQDIAGGIFCLNATGEKAASSPNKVEPRRAVAIQPYQYMAGPSSTVVGVQPHSIL